MNLVGLDENQPWSVVVNDCKEDRLILNKRR